MRILIVNDFASINGGASRVALTSAIGLANASHDVHVFAGAGPVDPKLLEAGVKVTCLERPVFQDRPALAALREGLWDRVARDRFSGTLADYDPKDTIVHVHTNRDVLSASVPALAIERGYPVVYTCHEYFLGCPYGAFFDLRLGIRCPERGGSFGCWTRPCNGSAVHKKIWSMTRSVMHERAGIPGKVRDFVFVSDFSQRILGSYLPSGARCHRVDNPVGAAKAGKKEFAEGEPFLFVGALAQGKNPRAACRAAAEVNRRVVYVGRGEMDSELRQEPNADVRGWQSESELVSSYRSARALVFVPIWPETQGLVVYEAAAHGLPSVVTDDCAAAGFVQEHDAGLVVPSGSHESLVEAMKTLGSTETAARLGANAYRAFWSDPPTLERHIQQLEAVYEQVLGAKVG